MQAINTNLLTAPTYREGPSGMMAGVPYYGILARFCNTLSGYEAFTHPGVNARFCKVFTEWHKYLRSDKSTSVIHNKKGGWLSPVALNAMITNADGNPEQHSFEDFYICDPKHIHYGFNSYDEIFVRELHPKHQFWIKNTPYSLSHILSGDELTDRFVGGTLLQAMLRSLDYHRWRSPVKGTVVKTRLISGATSGNLPTTYYAACLDDNHADLDVVSRSQDFVGVGLGEVSTCNIVVKDQVLQKGDELGQFHFGGSTYCLIIRPGLNVMPIREDGNNFLRSKVRVGKDILNVTKQD
ncbi:phosphatidylserine decarboxylase [Pisolithus marmoratus]|nr:phosphatidylserine decarboxylase [Pisolithus marmoratus]